MQMAGHANILLVLQVPGNKSDEVSCKRLLIIAFFLPGKFWVGRSRLSCVCLASSVLKQSCLITRQLRACQKKCFDLSIDSGY